MLFSTFCVNIVIKTNTQRKKFQRIFCHILFEHIYCSKLSIIHSVNHHSIHTLLITVLISFIMKYVLFMAVDIFF